MHGRWLMLIGGGFVLLGGGVAAVTGPLELTDGSWLAAYLVLVCGVPQYLTGQMAAHWLKARVAWALFTFWNLGNAAVIAGTLLTAPYLVYIGGAILLVPLVVMLRMALRRQDLEGHWNSKLGRWVLIAFLVVLIVSIPIGFVLANVRAG